MDLHETWLFLMSDAISTCTIILHVDNVYSSPLKIR